MLTNKIESDRCVEARQRSAYVILSTHSGSDKAVAQRLGRTVRAVATRRQRLGIPAGG